MTPGVHYVALVAKNRILITELPALGGQRYTWCWTKRNRPYVPGWSGAKLPRANFAPEENARLLSVYMRPWTLDPQSASDSNPLLTNFAAVNACTESATTPTQPSATTARIRYWKKRERSRSLRVVAAMPLEHRVVSGSWCHNRPNQMVGECHA